MPTFPESSMAGVRGESALISSMSLAPSSPGMMRSVKTRSMSPFLNRVSASSPLWQEMTRYPRVSSRTLRIDRDCSLSSTQRIVRFGFMMDPERDSAPKTRVQELGSGIRNLQRIFRAREILRTVEAPVKWRESQWEMFPIELYWSLCVTRFFAAITTGAARKFLRASLQSRFPPRARLPRGYRFSTRALKSCLDASFQCSAQSALARRAAPRHVPPSMQPHNRQQTPWPDLLRRRTTCVRGGGHQDLRSRGRRSRKNSLRFEQGTHARVFDRCAGFAMSRDFEWALL